MLRPRCAPESSVSSPATPGTSPRTHVRALRGLGFSGASIGLGVPGEVPQADLLQAREVLAAGGIRVAQASASYPPLVHPDEGQRREAIELVRRACAQARALDAVYLLVRSGSVNLGGNYYPHRENHTPATAERLIDSLRQVSAAAEAEGVTLGLECHVITTLESPQKVRQIIDAVGSPALRYNADPVNFVSSFADAYDTPAVLRRVFEHLGDVHRQRPRQGRLPGRPPGGAHQTSAPPGRASSTWPPS